MAEQTQTPTEMETEEAGAQTCPNCGMAREDWQGNSGQGYEYNGQMYCCQGCAEGTGCTCQ
jgi:hypothetical protein